MKSLYYLCVILLVAALPACCSEDCVSPVIPDRELAVHVDVDDHFEDYKNIEMGRGESMLIRFTAVAYQGEKIVSTMVSMVPDFSMKLPNDDCLLAVFADFVLESSSEDYHFFTDIFSEILLKNRVSYLPDVPSRVAFYGNENVSATMTQANIKVSTAMAKYRLEATDAPDYEVGNIRISFNSAYPAAINGFNGNVCRGWSGLAFNSQCAGEMIAADMVFAEFEEIMLSARVEVYDTDGKLRARIKSVGIPVKRGGITTVRGPFFTTFEEDEPGPDSGGSGIEIDPSFTTDIIIKI